MQNTALYIVTDMQPLGDDGNAIHMLLQEQGIKLDGLIATSGNVWSEEAADNVSDLLRSIDRNDVPVFCPVTSGYHRARQSFFENRERNRWWRRNFCGALALAPPQTTVTGRFEISNKSVCDAMAANKADNITFIVTGPATALAAILASCPGVRNRVKHIYMMGGALSFPGNVTPHAEFNIWFDPGAADYVLASGLPITLLPLDAVINIHYPAGITEGKNSQFAHYLADYLQRRQKSGDPVPLWDEVLAAIFIQPELVLEDEQAHLRVENNGGERFGALMKTPGVYEDYPAIKIITKIDQAALFKLISSLL